MRFAILSGLTILLASCAGTTNYYSQTVQSWQGGSARTLAQKWGSPDNVLKGAGGNTVYVYKTQSYASNNNASSPAVGVNMSSDGRPVITTTPNTNINGNRGTSLACMAIFTANAKGMIIDTKIQGNSCYGGSGFASRLGNPANPVNIAQKQG